MANIQIDTAIQLVNAAIEEFYRNDINLIDRGLCERCLVHRLAVYLERLFNGYCVDCEFNKSFYEDVVNNKVLSNINGNYVDILIHKRSNIPGENLLCFELKKSTNYIGRNKDRENLRILTRLGRFEYQYGFYIILGNTLNKVKLEVYSRGELLDYLF